MRLIRFMRATWNIPDPLVRLVRSKFALSVDGEEHMRTCMHEVLQNTSDHAQSPIGGVLCARYMSGDRQVRVAVVDRGLGILQTLARRYSELTKDGDALVRVVQGGFTAKSTPRNLGVGLRNLAMFATGQGGRVTLVSGRGVLELDSISKPLRAETMTSRFQGTAVFFTLNVDLGTDEAQPHVG